MKLPHSSASAADQRQVTYSCVERWAARLSRSPDSAGDVAVAAFAACEDAVFVYNERLAAEQTTGSLEQTPGFWLRRARFIAVQTRAGDCYPDA